MKRDTPLHTFWAIILMSLLALITTHSLGIPGDQAIWVFVGCMALGLPLGELAERVLNNKR